MELRNQLTFLIEREEGLALLEVWEKTEMIGMKCYGNTDSYLRVGNILRKLRNKNTTFVEVDAQDYFAFSINIITNYKLISKVRQ